MGRGKQEERKAPSLREQIRAYRRTLKGKVAEAFDDAFFEVSKADRDKGINKALDGAHDCRKAFTAAKQAADAVPKDERDPEDESVGDD